MAYIDSIAAFVQSAKAGSFSEAAKIMGVSGSTVSRKVAKVELDYGQELFIRKGPLLTLNEEGEILFNKLEKISFEFGSVLSDLCEAGPSNNIKIFAGSLDNLFIIQHVLPELLQTYPDLKIEFCSHTRYCLTEYSEYITNYINKYDFIFIPEDNLPIVDDKYWEHLWSFSSARGIYISSKAILAESNLKVPRKLEELSNFPVHKWCYDDDVWTLYNKSRKEKTVQTRAVISLDSYTSILESLNATAGVALLTPALVNSQADGKNLRRIFPNLQAKEAKYHAFMKKGENPYKHKFIREILGLIQTKLTSFYCNGQRNL